jgi:hypothetical protein
MPLSLTRRQCNQDLRGEKKANLVLQQEIWENWFCLILVAGSLFSFHIRYFILLIWRATRAASTNF